MALGGISPVIIFTFYKAIKVPNFLKGFISSVKIPLVPIPIYLDEKRTGITLDDYNRTISVDIMRDGVSSFERVSGDVVQLKFRASKNNIALTSILAIFDKIIEVVETKEYSITLFYDDIFILDSSLEQFQTTLVEGTDLREISLQLAKRPPAEETAKVNIIKNTGTSAGIV